MKISTKGRYGLRTLVDMVIYSSGEYMPLCKIAERQKISENYLEHIFSMLKKAGLVKSTKGSQGGYMLSKNPYSIKVGDILRTLEGDLSVIDNNNQKDENGLESFIKRKVWSELDNVINNVVDSISLQDVVDEYRKINEENAYIYHI